MSAAKVQMILFMKIVITQVQRLDGDRKTQLSNHVSLLTNVSPEHIFVDKDPL